MMGEGGCCGGCLAMILGIVGAILAIAWGIIKFIVELFFDIIGWVLKKIFGLFAWVGEQIKDLYLYINQGCLNVVGIPVWGVILLLIAIVFAIFLIYVIVNKIIFWRLSSIVSEFRKKANQFEKDERFWDAVGEWRIACERMEARKADSSDDERILNILKDLRCSYDSALYSALKADTQSIVYGAEDLEGKGQFREAATEWGKAFDLACARSKNLYVGSLTGVFIAGLRASYDYALFEALEADAKEFVERAEQYEKASQFKEAAAEWDNAISFVEKRREGLRAQEKIEDLLADYVEKSEKNMLNDANLVVNPIIQKARKFYSQNDYLSSAKMYQKAAEKYRRYTPSVSLILSEARKCDFKYKKYIAKHVENQVKALEELDW